MLEVDTPEDLRKLPVSCLYELCDELRRYLIDHVASNGGHFSSSLGVVELTVALHYVFNTPEDKLVWDVGHQAYPHKLLTGRRARFYTNRLLGGISGFPCIEESEYDAFGTGHSSTSVSAILGMACAAKYREEHDRQHIAVIGDGAMTAGMAFEALNNAGYERANMLVILNDNNMSIDANTGALQSYLTALTTNKYYNALRKRLPSNEVVRQLEKALKGGLLRHSNFFEALGIRYFGPVDGHDLKQLMRVLEKLKYIPGPKLLHCVTEKGKGFAPAMVDKAKWHATTAFDKMTGVQVKKVNSGKTFQQIFGSTIIELAKENDKIVTVSPAMLSGSGLTEMKRVMGERVFDVGITEQHAVTFSAGLAVDGMVPYCTIYSTFLQRGYDQVIHDVALQKLKVVFCIDRAGVAGADGPTHHGVFDIAFLRCVPNVVGASPMDLAEFRSLLYTAQFADGPFAIRYPKAVGMGNSEVGFRKLEIGKGRRIRAGKDVAILSLGPVGQYVVAACEELEVDVAHYDLRFFKPLDEELLHEVFSTFSMVVTVEDGCIAGGVGSAVMEFMVEHGYGARLKRLGVRDVFAEQGTQEELHGLYGYDVEGIVREVKKFVGSLAI
jgi:1-deoxy-D-xylulose-5-phosphate synthase